MQSKSSVCVGSLSADRSDCLTSFRMMTMIRSAEMWTTMDCVGCAQRKFDYHYDEEYDDHEEDYDYLHFEEVLFRDFHKRPPIIRNPRDDRFFPGNIPAGVAGITPKLMRFITMHVNQVSYFIQGPPPSEKYP